MPHEVVAIVDAARNVVATATVASQGDSFSGSAHLDRMPDPIRKLFEEYEEIVNDQIFSLLDQIEDRISGSSFSVVFEGGLQAPVEDLQIFPRGGTISFKVARPAMLHGGR